MCTLIGYRNTRGKKDTYDTDSFARISITLLYATSFPDRRCKQSQT